MELNGREINFAYNMRAAKMLVDISPERDLSRLGDALTGKYGNAIENQARLIVALSTAYCLSSDHKAEGLQPVTMDEVLDLDPETFRDLFMAASNAFVDGQKTNVRTKPVPRKKAGTQPENQS